MGDVYVRWMIRRDMADVVQIEKDSFEFAWTEEDFLCCLRQRNCIGMVAEHQERIVGFMVYELLKDTLQLLNFAVKLDVRWKGVGKQMIQKMINKLHQQKRTSIILRIRETNISGIKFFQSQGFLAKRIDRLFFEDTTEDAYVMEWSIKNDPATPSTPSHNRIAPFLNDE